MTAASLRLEDVTFQYSSGRRVVEGFSLDIGPGEFGVLRGRNGSGKTTVLRLAAGLLAPNRGRVIRRGRLVHVPSALAFHESLTVDEQVRYLGHAGGLAPASIRSSLERWGFEEAMLRQEVSALSTGWRQRLGFALAAVADGQVLLLDEPLANLDVEASRLVVALVERALERQAAVLIAQHGDLGVLEHLPLQMIDLKAQGVA